MKEKISKILDKKELKLIKKLNYPIKIQDYLDQIPFNFEKKGETYMSPRESLKSKKMHCFEGAIFACLCLEFHRIPNYLLDLKVKEKYLRRDKDFDHTLGIYKLNGFWGAISKTNHSVLRFRDPIYKTTRELALSYFHEYFLNTGEKTLDSFSAPFDIWKKFGTDWIVNPKNLDEIAESLDVSKHFAFIPSKNRKHIRKVGKTEIKGAMVTQYN